MGELERRQKKSFVNQSKSDNAATKLDDATSNILDSLSLDQAIILAKQRVNFGALSEANFIYQDILAKFPGNKRALDASKALEKRTVTKSTIPQELLQASVEKLIGLYKQRQLDQALELVNLLLDKCPNHSLLYNISGAIHKAFGNTQESLTAYAKAVDIEPNFAEAHYNMGVALQENGSLQEALIAYDRAIAIKKNYAEAYNNMGIIFRQQKKMKHALQAFTKAILIRPNNSEAYNNKGNVFKDQGRISEALNSYKTSLNIQPDNVRAISNIIGLQVQLHKTKLYIENSLEKFSLESTKFRTEPKLQMYNAIGSFLLGDFDLLSQCLLRFESCSQLTFSKLTQKDKVFSLSYYTFLKKLILAEDMRYRVGQSNKSCFHLGDSHCLSYAHGLARIDGEDFRVEPRVIFGAKAYHFAEEKENSFKAITAANLECLANGSKVFISFGEIDCRANEGIIVASRKLKQPKSSIIAKMVLGFVKWFFDRNRFFNHTLLFFTVPAPIYDDCLCAASNAEVKETILMFNRELKRCVTKYNFNIIDVHCLTVDEIGFSNNVYHIDKYHLSPKTIQELQFVTNKSFHN